MPNPEDGFRIGFTKFGNSHAHTPVVVNAQELAYLLAHGAVKIESEYIRSALMAKIAHSYGETLGSEVGD